MRRHTRFVKTLRLPCLNAATIRCATVRLRHRRCTGLFQVFDWNGSGENATILNDCLLGLLRGSEGAVEGRGSGDKPDLAHGVRMADFAGQK